ncbi:MAG: ABC transporter substrate-binding protein [Chloroflexi bacterium]|nr:ABC transporter substrate-binding protein [Chloroflexota bacterium]
MRTIHLRGLAALFLITFLAAGCALFTTPAPPVTPAPTALPATATIEPTPTTPPQPTPTITIPADAAVLPIVLSPSFETLDPRTESSPEARALQSLLYQTLITLDAAGNPIAGLAYGWEATGDGLSYTFFIPTGASFSDGASITATVVAQNLNEFLLTAGDEAAIYPYNIIDTIDAVDEATLAIRLKQPCNTFLQALANPRLSIISPDWLSRPSASLADSPAGSGPYRLVSVETGSQLTFLKRPEYAAAPVFFNLVRVSLVASAAEVRDQLTAGQALLGVFPQAAQRDPLPAAESTLQTRLLALPELQVMAFNLNSPFLNSLQVRQTLNRAIDRAALIQNIFMEDALAPSGIYPAGMLGACAGEEDYAYNPDLLSGPLPWEKVTLRALAPEGLYRQDRALIEAMSSQLALAGITLTVDYTSREDYTRLVIENQPLANYDLYFMQFESPSFSPAALDEWFRTNGALNGGNYANPQVDDLLTRSSREMETELAEAQYCQAAQQIWADAPYLFLIQPAYTVAYSSVLQGFTASPDGWLRLDLLRAESTAPQE